MGSRRCSNTVRLLGVTSIELLYVFALIDLFKLCAFTGLCGQFTAVFIIRAGVFVGVKLEENNFPRDHAIERYFACVRIPSTAVDTSNGPQPRRKPLASSILWEQRRGRLVGKSTHGEEAVHVTLVPCS